MASGRSDSGIFILLGALVVVLGGLLFFKAHSAGSTPLIPAPKEEAAGLSNALDINVYLDGSGSIKHFLQSAPIKQDEGPPQANFFKALLDKVEVSLHNAPSCRPLERRAPALLEVRQRPVHADSLEWRARTHEHRPERVF